MESPYSKQSRLPSLGRTWRLRALFAIAVIWLGPALACGSFAPRPTPTPTILPAGTAIVQETEAAVVVDLQNTPVPLVAPDTPPPAATATLTPTVATAGTVGTDLLAGQPARVTAPNGLNLRDQPNTNGQLLLQLATNTKVSVLEGPSEGEGFTWWKVDDGQGNVGWVAESDGETEWLSPRLGEPQPVERAPRVGDRVQVVMASGGQLSVRVTPGTDAEVVTRVNPGDQFTVTGGPQESSGYTWYQIRSDDGSVEGWAADGDDTERWLSPLE